MVRETFGPHPRPSSAPDIVTYLTRTLLLRISILLPVSGDALVFFSDKNSLTQMDTPLYNYLDDITLLYMGTLARLPTYERYLGTQTITRSTPEIYRCSTFRQSRKFVANKRKHTLTLLWPQLPFFVYQLSQHIPPGNISFKGNAAELVDMHLNSCFSFRFHRITIINVAPTHHILLPGLPVLFTVHRQ